MCSRSGRRSCEGCGNVLVQSRSNTFTPVGHICEPAVGLFQIDVPSDRFDTGPKGVVGSCCTRRPFVSVGYNAIQTCGQLVVVLLLAQIVVALVLVGLAAIPKGRIEEAETEPLALGDDTPVQGTTH
jgi:hypothetical protein